MSFLGMPVDGEIYIPHNRNVEQKSEEEVDDLFQAVIERPEVLGLHWIQFTPYWNDGDPCIFSVGEPYIALKDSAMTDDHYFESSLAEYDYEETGRIWLSEYNTEFKRLVGRRKSYRDETEVKVNESLFDAVFTLFGAMNKGQMDEVLLKKFGDHAEVLIDVKAGKVVIEVCEHD